MNWQIATGIASSVIALCALVFSMWQAAQTRKHNRLSFRPHLTTWTHKHPEKGVFAVELLNNGLGPAIIREFSVTVDGKRISGDGTEAIDEALKILFPNMAYSATFSAVMKGYSMASKERCTIAAVQFTGPQFPSLELVEHTFSRGDIKITYCSFYEEEFQMSLQEEKSNKPLQPIAR